MSDDLSAFILADKLYTFYAILVQEIRERGGTVEMLHDLCRREGHPTIGEIAELIIRFAVVRE